MLFPEPETGPLQQLVAICKRSDQLSAQAKCDCVHLNHLSYKCYRVNNIMDYIQTLIFNKIRCTLVPFLNYKNLRIP